LSRWYADTEIPRLRARNDTGWCVSVRAAALRRRRNRLGRLELRRDIRGRIGIEWIRYRLHEETVQVVFVEYVVDIDCTVNRIPGRVPVGIAVRVVDGVRGIDRFRSVRVCHRILLHRDTRRIDAEAAVR
jgi:hypothetical protein